MDVPERLLAALAKDADCIDDHIDASESWHPYRGIQITCEIGCDCIGMGAGVPADGDHPVPGLAERDDQSATNESCGAGDQDDHVEV